MDMYYSRHQKKKSQTRPPWEFHPGKYNLPLSINNSTDKDTQVRYTNEQETWFRLKEDIDSLLQKYLKCSKSHSHTLSKRGNWGLIRAEAYQWGNWSTRVDEDLREGRPRHT